MLDTLDTRVRTAHRAMSNAPHPIDATLSRSQTAASRAVLSLVTLLGVYLSITGYRSFEGDQAYRLPLLLRHHDNNLYEHDSFVRSFDEFNPHTGALTLLDFVSRILGLPAALFGLYALTFVVTGLGVRRLVQLAWPALSESAGLVVCCMFLLAKAGNIGTNHLFEPMLLDRGMVYALGWLMLAEFVGGARRSLLTIPCLLVAAQWIHPSLGLQLGALLAVAALLCALLPQGTGVSRRQALILVAAIAACLAPAITGAADQSARLFTGMPRDDYIKVVAFIQSPQHMIPHLWRASQWWAALGFLGLAALGVAHAESNPHVDADAQAKSSATYERNRIVLLLSVALVGLACATIAIEVLHDAKVTLIQPFRIATIARGLSLILGTRHVLGLWQRNNSLDRVRAAALVLGLIGDWLFACATLVELATAASERLCLHKRWTRALTLIGWIVAFFAMRAHDTHHGDAWLLFAIGAGEIAGRLSISLRRDWTTARLARLCAFACFVPALAFVVGWIAPSSDGWRGALVGHIRVVEQPIDDIERLGAWCRVHTPRDAVFVGPPGEKGFRLWSRRALAFNRAGSPYHAAGIADWVARFCDHVRVNRSIHELAALYLRDRHALEHRYDEMSNHELASLARAQGADYVVAASGRRIEPDGPFERLRAEGPWAVYQVRYQTARLTAR